MPHTKHDENGLYQRIGRVASYWAALEFSINVCIWDLSNVEKECGACITSQIVPIGSRMRALVALATLRGAKEPLVKALNGFSARVDGLGRQRNRIVHDPWISSTSSAGESISRLEISADRKLVFELKPTEMAEIDALADKILHATDDFSPLYRRLLAELPPWPRKQFLESAGMSVSPK